MYKCLSHSWYALSGSIIFHTDEEYQVTVKHSEVNINHPLFFWKYQDSRLFPPFLIYNMMWIKSLKKKEKKRKKLNCNHTMQWSTDLDFAFILSSVFLNGHGVLILPCWLFQPCLQSLLVPVHLGFHLLQLLRLLEYVVLKNKKFS